MCETQLDSVKNRARASMHPFFGFPPITRYSLSIQENKHGQKLGSATFSVARTKPLLNRYFLFFSRAPFFTSAFSLTPLCPLVVSRILVSRGRLFCRSQVSSLVPTFARLHSFSHLCAPLSFQESWYLEVGCFVGHKSQLVIKFRYILSLEST